VELLVFTESVLVGLELLEAVGVGFVFVFVFGFGFGFGFGRCGGFAREGLLPLERPRGKTGS
jgi:hypothetical protein